jgi:hypothetical protein
MSISPTERAAPTSDKTLENGETDMIGRPGMLCIEPAGDRDECIENPVEVASFAAVHLIFLRYRKLGRVIGPAAQDLDLLVLPEACIADDILRRLE